ncbi:MAG: DUF3313 family protein, partial [Sphingomonadales bacterium]
MKKYRETIVGIFLAGAISFGTNAQTIDTSEEGVKSEEGLYLVEDAKVNIAFAHPDFDLGNYNQVMIEPLEFALEQNEAEEKKKQRRNCSVSADKLAACTGDNPFAITEEDKSKMVEVFAEIMASHMGKGPPIEMVTEAASGVLVFKPTIAQINITAPRDSSRYSSSRSARTRVYTRSSGSITLVGQFFDGGTGALVAYIIDQQIGTDVWHSNDRVS